MSDFDSGEIRVVSSVPGGTQDVRVVSDTDDLAKNTTLTDGTQKTQVTNFPATQDVHVTNIPTVNVGTMPEVEISNDSGNPVPVSGSVSVSNFPATQNVAVTSSVEVEVKNDIGSPVPVSGTVTAVPTGTQDVSIVGTSVTQPISAASLPLPTGAATSALQTQPGVDIGDVTVNNASGASAVNVQDGGNSLTVDGTVAATQSGTWTVQPGNTQNTTPWLVESRVGTPITYSAAITQLATATTATDIATITGSGTKTIKVLQVVLTATETTSAVRDVFLIKRSTANSGGTSSTITNVPNDSSNAAATATVRSYTANPTLGTSVGTIRARKTDISATNLVGSSDRVIWDFGFMRQPVVLRGTGEVLAINLNGVTWAGSSVNIEIEWIEE